MCFSFKFITTMAKHHQYATESFILGLVVTDAEPMKRPIKKKRNEKRDELEDFLNAL